VRAIPAHRAHLDHLASALRERETRALTAARAHLSRAHASLEALSPLAVLGRGYAIVTDEAGQILRAAAQAPAGTRVRVRLDRGALRARVEAQEDEATDPAPS
jgi:exodeoxyribonuclease VII large subunit